MDWLSDTSGRGWRIGFSVVVGLVVAVGLMMFMRGSINASSWIVLLLLILAVSRAIRRSEGRSARRAEKRKHADSFDEDDEKVKHEPTYVLGDDGELIPVDELEEKPKHSEYL